MAAPVLDARAAVAAVDEANAKVRPVGIVVNPRARAAVPAPLWERTVTALGDGGASTQTIDTTPDAANVDRVALLVEELHPTTVVAAGGDGTVSNVVEGLMRAHVETRPALAILPLGTANNVARSLGLRSYRRVGATALDLAVATSRSGVLQPLDLGYVETNEGDGAYFVGSFAIGMDAQILQTRNRLRRRFRLGPRTGGYPLYLVSCALCLLSQRRTAMHIGVDGSTFSQPLYNLLMLNAPLYAGEFRFDAQANVADGFLELNVFGGAVDYVRQFVSAWRRHVRYTAGHRVAAPRPLQRVREVDVALASPVPAQRDGEECMASAGYRVHVVQRALFVRTPALLECP